MLGRLRNFLRPRVTVQRTLARYPPQAALAGRLALVTGVTGGIGAAVARAVVEQGGQVIGVGRRADALERLARELGEAFTPLAADLSRQGVDDCLARLPDGPVDVLVHSAGLQRVEAAEAMAVESWDETVDVNLRAAWLLTRAVLPGMRARNSGHLVYLSSVMSRTAAPGQTAYCASKWGLDGMVQALRLEVKGSRIRVASIHPGQVATGIRGPASETDALSLQPEDVARTVLFVLTQPEYVSLREVHLASVDEINEFRG